MLSIKIQDLTLAHDGSSHVMHMQVLQDIMDLVVDSNGSEKQIATPIGQKDRVLTDIVSPHVANGKLPSTQLDSMA